jgi:DNA-binding NarL/FixJ family response regulator
MSWTGLALNRIQEIRAAQPDVAVLGLSDRDADWVIAGLRAGANAVVPRDLQPATLALVLREVTGGAPATTEMSAA